MAETSKATREGYEWADFAAIPPVECPCGMARRAFADVPDYPGTVHVTEIRRAATRHYHRQLTEVYYFLQCAPDTQIELAGTLHPVGAGSCILIRPGTRHRVVGKATVLILVTPKFDPADEWFD